MTNDTIMFKLNEIDRKILNELQKDGDLSNNLLAERVMISPSSCLRRVRALEESGIIDKYVALVDPKKLGLGLTVFSRVWLVSQNAETVEHFSREVLLLPEVLECHLMAGDCDFMLRVIISDLEEYRKFLSQYLTRIQGVKMIKTEIPLQSIKLTTEIPLP